MIKLGSQERWDGASYRESPLKTSTSDIRAAFKVILIKFKTFQKFIGLTPNTFKKFLIREISKL